LNLKDKFDILENAHAPLPFNGIFLNEIDLNWAGKIYYAWKDEIVSIDR
jgi:hypothetical protein